MAAVESRRAAGPDFAIPFVHARKPVAVNAPVFLETLLRRDDDAQRPLPLSTEGIQRHVWESRYGTILIEVIDGRVLVNGEAVEPAESPRTT